ncbi:glycosyltransferase [Aeromicrobium sp. UC242_57]|uniref:glycosyltransferase n=1 Tax=Aeromicrobium sp. UC242_57 TaxID=3374624 RepID=UPI0037B688A2
MIPDSRTSAPSHGSTAEPFRLIRRQATRGHVALLLGRGGNGVPEADVTRAVKSTPRWTWTLLGADQSSWVDDPWDVLVRSDVVVTHAGQNALAEVAAARRPAIAFPQERPHDEQHTTAAALRRDGRFPVVALDAFPTHGWPQLLAGAAELDGTRWSAWNDGKGAARAAAVIEREART